MNSAFATQKVLFILNLLIEKQLANFELQLV